MKSRKQGFTLIELLVVIAIIGILSSVVLASLRSAREKGADAAIKANLANMRPAAELYYEDNNGSYNGLCDAQTQESDGYRAALDLAGGIGQCQDSPDSWAAAVTLSSCWCVDYTGFAGKIQACDSSSDLIVNIDDDSQLSAASLAALQNINLPLPKIGITYACL